MNNFLNYWRSLDWPALTDMLENIIPSLLCITLHELAHGFVAYKLGDDTAKRAGRLTLNPVRHIDLFGLLMMIVFRFGWAKPVPVDMRNFKNPKRGMALTALAGPLCNFILCCFFLFVYGLLFYPLYPLSVGGSAMADFVLTLVMVAIGTMVLINVIKVPWGRVRMRLIVQTGNESYFTPWWQAGTALKDRLVAEGISKDEFRSFPSGHTACASCAKLLALLPTLSREKRKKTGALLAGGCLWALVVAFTRIWMGAHFLTDVTMAWLITLGMTALSVYLCYFNKKFFDAFWQFVTQLPNPFGRKQPKAAREEHEEL